ncbi:hypothetical protein TNCV_4903871 [Trichonephila clavipes]|nr:hypothetical protein TNCV_4903871 [Trichonephila clavipes]
MVEGAAVLHYRKHKWHRAFMEDRAGFEDPERSGCPQTSRPIENIEKVSAAIRRIDFKPLRGENENSYFATLSLLP